MTARYDVVFLDANDIMFNYSCAELSVSTSPRRVYSLRLSTLRTGPFHG